MSVILSSTLGFFLGSSFLVHLEGFDFVMTALFTVLALDAYRANPDRLTVLFIGDRGGNGVDYCPGVDALGGDGCVYGASGGALCSGEENVVLCLSICWSPTSLHTIARNTIA